MIRLPPELSPRGVIFDLDGTLLDTEALLDECILEAAQELGFSPSPADLLSVRGLADHGEGGWPSTLIARLQQPCSARVAGGAGARAPAPETAASVALFSSTDRIFTARAADVGAMPGAARVVGALAAARVPLAIATSSMRAAVALKRTRHEDTIFSHFGDRIVCVEDVNPRPKPDPLCFQKAAALLGLPPSACVAVEDSIPGITAAVAAGCITVAIPLPAHRDAARALGATLVLPSLDSWELGADDFAEKN